MKKIIKSLIIANVFLLPFIIFPYTFYPHVFSKSLFFEGMVLLTGLLWFIDRVFNKENYKISYNITFWVFLIYIGTLLLSGVFGFMPSLSFWGSMDHGIATVFIIHLFFFFTMLISVFKDKKDWYRLFSFISLAGILFTVLSMLGQAGVKFSKIIPLTNMNGFLIGNSSWTGVYIAFIFFISFGILLSAEKKIHRVLGGIGLITSFFDPILTGFILRTPGQSFTFVGFARAASYSLIAGLLLFLIYFVYTKIKSADIRKKLVQVFLVLSIAGFACFMVFGIGPMKKFVAEKAGPNRLVYWDIAMEGFKEKPILGWGGETYQYIYTKYFNPVIATEGYAKEYWVDRSHNIYLDELSAGGIIGLLSLISIYLIILFYLLKQASLTTERQGFMYVALSAGLVSFLVQGLMIFQTILGWVFVALILAFTSVFCFPQKYKEQKLDKNNFKKELTALYIILFVVIFGYTITKPYKISRGLSEFPIKSYEERLAFYDKLDKSYLGNLTDIGNAFLPYHVRLRQILKQGLTEDQKKLVVKEIDKIGEIMDHSLEKQRYYEFKILTAATGFYSISTAITDGEDRLKHYEKGLQYVEKMKEVSPKNAVRDTAQTLLEYSFEYGEEGLDVLDTGNNTK